VGNSVRLTGPVGTYRDNVQVAVRDAANLQILDDAGSVISQAPAGTADTSAASAATSTSADAAGEAVAMAISDIDGSTVGKRVILEGRVVAFRASWSERAPNIISLSDGTSTIPVVAWADTWNALTRKPAEGDTIRLTGEVQLYEARNEIQVHLQSLEFPQ
jgi:DNA/RNA endonuclease YhcR with UshA esterase domain